MAGKIVDVTLRLVDQVSTPIKGIESSLKQNANQWTRAGKQIQAAGKSISSVGSTLTKTVTLPIVGAGAAAIKLAADFEEGMSKVQSISGATADELTELGDKAKEMGAKTKFSATEATEAYQYMAMAGWKAEDMLDGVEGVMYLAGATGLDLASTSDIVTDALTAFGMTASDTQELVDVMATTAANANTDVAMMGESFKYVAPVAGALGYSVEDVSTALGLMANSGVKASTAGTALRTWMSNMSAPTSAVAGAMEELGISLTNSDGSMKSFNDVMEETRGAFSDLTEAQKAQYAKTLAGKQGMSGLLAIINSSDEDFDNLTAAIQDSNGACEDMYETANDNLSGQLTILKSSVESLAISFGEMLLPYIKQAATWVQTVTDKLNSLDDGTKQLVVRVALIAAAVGPVLLIFGKTVSVVGKVVSIFGMLGKAVKAFGSIAGLLTSPAAVVIGVMAAIAIIAVLVIKNWDKIKAVFEKVGNFIKKVANSMGLSFDSIKEKLAPLGEHFQEIGGKLQELWAVVQPVVSKIGDIVMRVFQGVIGAAIGAAIGFFSSAFDTIVEIVDGILTIFGGIIDFITGVFTGNWEKAWEGVKSIFDGVFQSLVALVKAPMNAVISIINGAISGINNLGLTIPDWVPIIGGQDFSINIPTIPTLAVGTDNWKGGIVQISERGGEIVDLPQGSRVYPHDQSVQQAYRDGAQSGNITLNMPKLADSITIRDDSDIQKIAAALGDMLLEKSQNMGGAQIGYSY